ncbi:DUF2092 domain-containing protein [Primorskyibacter sp. S87]|uniref:DUF2092 domain-containing protein n=1 Tax=Primorskyibacter sp. S87 TaxID=3415126 RepID=UPI003C7E8884
MPSSGVSAEEEGKEAPAIDPRAVEVLSLAIEYLSGQEALSVDWFVSYDQVVDGREKLTRVRSGRNVMARGKGLYSYSENGSETREYFFDGSTFQVVDRDNLVFAEARFAGGIDELADATQEKFGVTLPMWQVLTNGSRSELINDATAAAYLGETRLAGRAVHHLAFSNYDNDWQVWVLADAVNPELVMLVGTDPYTQGWPQYRAYFTSWDFSPEIGEGTFHFQPDDSFEQMTWSTPVVER